jgi:hypothetical protein
MCRSVGLVRYWVTLTRFFYPIPRPSPATSMAGIPKHQGRGAILGEFRNNLLHFARIVPIFVLFK